MKAKSSRACLAPGSELEAALAEAVRVRDELDAVIARAKA